jgi:hypothetical protein
MRKARNAVQFPIDRATAGKLYDIYQRALDVLSEAEAALEGVEEATWDAYFEPYSEIVTNILWKLRGPLVMQYRDLDTEGPEGPPNTLLEPEEQQVVDRLSAAEIQRIDEALLADCSTHARKVARIVGTAWTALRDDLLDVPMGFYVQRVQAIVATDRLESRGNLDYARFSEVRLPRDPLDDVVDAPLDVNVATMTALRAFRDRPKRTDLAEAEPDDPSRDLSPSLARLADRLLQGIADHPSKRWVLAQFQQSLVPIVLFDEEGRERFGDELENLMQILGIESDDGVLDHYLDWR